MLQLNASDYNIPIFMSETGCNLVKPRNFDDQSALFGPDMADSWSGSVVYEWIEETNNYGIVSYGAPADPTATGDGVYEGYTRTGTPTPVSPDFDHLSSQWATLTPAGVSADAYTPAASPPACPAFTSGMWEVSGNAPLPTIGAKFTDYTSALSSASADGPGTSTSASSAASSTRVSSIALSRRNMESFWSKVGKWTREHPAAWYGLVVLGFFIIGVVVL